MTARKKATAARYHTKTRISRSQYPEKHLNAHTHLYTRHAHTECTALGDFGVQIMFYFGNSVGLVTLLW